MDMHKKGAASFLYISAYIYSGMPAQSKNVFSCNVASYNGCMYIYNHFTYHIHSPESYKGGQSDAAFHANPFHSTYMSCVTSRKACITKLYSYVSICTYNYYRDVATSSDCDCCYSYVHVLLQGWTWDWSGKTAGSLYQLFHCIYIRILVRKIW